MVCCSLAAAATPVAAPAQGERPGRLFFTPAQRASLDVARSQRARAALDTEKTEDAFRRNRRIELKLTER